jgi:hypothetical protein
VSPLRLAASALAAALLLAAAPAAGPGAAVGKVVAAHASSAADAHAAAKPRACSRSRRRARHRRRVACTRIKRLVTEQPVEERLVQVGAPQPPQGESQPPGGSPPPPAPLPRFVSVSAREWSLTLSRPLVGAGSVTIELRNVGEDPHNLVLSPDDGSHTHLDAWAETDPGGVLRRSVSLPAGRYLLFCSLDGHEAAGMSARLRVE